MISSRPGSSEFCSCVKSSKVEVFDEENSELTLTKVVLNSLPILAFLTISLTKRTVLKLQKAFKSSNNMIRVMQRQTFIQHLEILFALIQAKAVKAITTKGRIESSSLEAKNTFLRIYKEEWTRAKNEVLAWIREAGIQGLDTAYSIATRQVYALANSLVKKSSISPRNLNEITTGFSASIAKEIGCPGYSNRFMAFLEAYLIDKSKRTLRHPSNGRQYSETEFTGFRQRLAAILELDRAFIVGELLKERQNLLTSDGLRDYREIVFIVLKIIMPHLIRSLKKARNNFAAIIEATIKYYIPKIQNGKIAVELEGEESPEEKRRRLEAAQIADVNEVIYGVKLRDHSWLLKKDLFEDPLARKKVG